MSDINTFQGIANDAKDIFQTSITWAEIPTNQVPNDDDAGLTFETGNTKKGKKMTTAVLFVDLRNSTTLNFEHDQDKLGKLYAAFVRSMIQCAEQYGGVVRNIIGDRLMVVFPAANCCTNAVNTAISMNTVVTRILNPLFKGADVKAGIGIDYGTMYVEKVGVPKPGKERDAYKNLVWLGQPANVASKLTDLAGKVSNGIELSNILLSERTYKKYVAESPNEHDIKQGFWKEQNAGLAKELTASVVGCNTIWKSASSMAI